jgi:GT2 family glycosyltransferase
MISPVKLALYGVALGWAAAVFAAWRGLPQVADLTRPEHDRVPAGEPSLTVVVPARNEQADIEACVRSLLAQDYARMDVIAVNDRSTDETGVTMERMALETPVARLHVVHIATLPAGWLGKTHAMAEAAATSTSEFLLFTDADVTFRPDALRRAMAYAQATGADHLVLGPTTVIRRWDEAGLLGLFQIFGLWGARPWRVANPRARDAIGIGAFNLIRRSAYVRVGGFAALRMEIVEDLGLGRRVKAFGLRQRFAFGPGLVKVHWASGATGLIGVMTKNVFAVFRYNIALLLVGCGWLAVFCIAPFFAVWVPGFRLPGILCVALIAWGYALLGRLSGLSAWNALLTPFAAGAFIFTLLRSMVTTLRQGGVVWRGTFYPLEELRENAAPLLPQRLG